MVTTAARPCVLEQARARREAKPRQLIYAGNWRELVRRRQARILLRLTGEPIPAAYVGRRHPDYGMTVAEHLQAKAARRAIAA